MSELVHDIDTYDEPLDIIEQPSYSLDDIRLVVRDEVQSYGDSALAGLSAEIAEVSKKDNEKIDIPDYSKDIKEIKNAVSSDGTSIVVLDQSQVDYVHGAVQTGMTLLLLIALFSSAACGISLWGLFSRRFRHG